MSEIWKPLNQAVYLQWIEKITKEISDSLNDWETRFIHDIGFRLLRGFNLSKSQANHLENIYSRTS